MDYRLSPEAELDLDEIWLYIARESGSMEIATRLGDSITDQFFLLARNPYLGRARDEDFGAGPRSFPVRKYLIVYCVENNEVLILRVAHGQRDVGELFEDD